mmetsp:Transcript_10321/g.22022  ORF Transcript_10321/g.22022 Transcript_10321/m.22022 type:complete len:227 (-) Transcript_10321:289-969(-)
MRADDRRSSPGAAPQLPCSSLSKHTTTLQASSVCTSSNLVRVRAPMRRRSARAALMRCMVALRSAIQDALPRMTARFQHLRLTFSISFRFFFRQRVDFRSRAFSRMFMALRAFAFSWLKIRVSSLNWLATSVAFRNMSAAREFFDFPILLWASSSLRVCSRCLEDSILCCNSTRDNLAASKIEFTSSRTFRLARRTFSLIKMTWRSCHTKVLSIAWSEVLSFFSIY